MAANRRRTKLAHVSREELDHLYYGQGLTTKDIGNLFGVSDELIRYHMARLGIARRGRPWSSKHIRSQLDCNTLERLYVLEGLSMAEIGRRFGVGETTVPTYLKKCGILRRNLSAATIRYPRRNFSGDLIEKAYLIGFRQGDLWVAPTNNGPFSGSISVACATSREEQITLFKELFASYGHVAVSPGRKGKYVQYSLQCCLNLTFDFLVAKEDCIPEQIHNDPSLFVAFLAGYIDAEGSFGLPRDGTSRFVLGSYDVTILHQLHGVLTTQYGIQCPPPRLSAPKGSPVSGGYQSRNDFWVLQIGSKCALHRLCQLVEPRLKHAKRRQDMYKVWRNVIRRGVEGCE